MQEKKSDRIGRIKVNPKELRTMDGIVFASTMEMKAYWYLKLTGARLRFYFVLQPRFELLPPFTTEMGEKIEPIDYIGDFAIGDIVLDTKGMETDIFKLKRKMFLQKYPEKIFLLMRPKGKNWLFYRNFEKKENLISVKEFEDMIIQKESAFKSTIDGAGV